MANITRNFTAGRMNKVVDERLIPNGEYIDALNIRMGSTENRIMNMIKPQTDKITCYIRGNKIYFNEKPTDVVEKPAEEAPAEE
jgi:hypothetical protein